jgi:S1-C subfamily serine protease
VWEARKVEIAIGELRLMIGSMAPGTKAHIEINREGETKTFDVQLGEMPPTAAA